MQDKQRIKKRIEKVIISHGYRKYASFAESKAVGDIIFYFWMEAPTNTVYISFCVYPTFMPPQEIPKCTVFGNRISMAFPDLGWFNENDDDEALESKLIKLDCFISERIEPLVTLLSNRETFIDTLYQANKLGLLRYIPDHKYRLLIYNALYNRDYSDELNYADEYVGMMYYYKETPELIEKAEKEVKRIKEMVTAKD